MSRESRELTTRPRIGELSTEPNPTNPGSQSDLTTESGRGVFTCRAAAMLARVSANRGRIWSDVRTSRCRRDLGAERGQPS